ncbi:MAG: L-fucose:H+ symporter permease, partial [Flammeovirgaceae bacterium]|nr:L-fucose:H+ symporter permease [Flammeovirgaceae bacterium]
RKYSYKVGILIGLTLYATGALLFYPAAVTEQFLFFLAGLYILTFGLAFLETSANPYILAMGDSSTATQRLNLAQAFNPVGNILGLLVAQQFVLKKLQSDNVDFASLSETQKAAITTADLMVIRDPYVILGIVVIAVLVLIVINKMPKGKGGEMHMPLSKVFGSLIKKSIYVEGVITQAFYVGAQIMCWTYIYQYAEAIGLSAEEAGTYQFFAFVSFFLGRFICTFLLKYVDSGKLLMGLSFLAVLFTLATMFITGLLGLYALVAISFCMSLMFPTIYGVALEGLSEDESKIGAAGLVMAIVGGALMPTLQGMILDLGGSGYADLQILGVSEVNFSFILPLVCFLIIAFYGQRVAVKHQKS